MTSLRGYGAAAILAASGLAILVLVGCAPGPVHPSATADDLLRAQYAAGGKHGAMGGEEAARIMQTYSNGIGRDLPPQPDASSTADREVSHEY